MTFQQCICQICTCGQHHCPQQSNGEEHCLHYTDCLLTEYQENFLAYCNTAPCAAIKPQDEWQPFEGKMENTTTFRLDYIPHELTRRHSKTAVLYVPPDSTMMLTSTYSEDYKKHPVQTCIVNKQTRQYHPSATKMNAISTYKEEFKPWYVEKRQPFKTTDNLTLRQGKFVTTTTFRDDYCHQSHTSPRENFKPIPQTIETSPFDGTTNYKLHFVHHPVQSKHPRKKEKYRSSTHKEGYTEVASTHVAKHITPKLTLESNCCEYTTECHDQYKPWSLEPNQSHKSEIYRHPVGDTTFLSTTHADYVAHEYQQVQHVRPPIHTWEKDKEPFQGMSVMKEDYKAWNMAHEPPAQLMVKPSGTFDKTTTTKCQRRPKARQQPNANMPMPVQNASSSKQVLKDSLTTNTGKLQGLCPASFAEPPGFEYTCNKDGHRLYRTLSIQHGPLAQETSKKSFKSSQKQKICAG